MFKKTLIIMILLSVSIMSEEITNKSAAEIFTFAEFKQMVKDIPDDQNLTEYPARILKSTQEQLPKSFDWRHYGIMTSVKNQRKCGSCWAFAVVGMIEALIKKTEHITVDLAEQQLVNCVAGSNCSGGNVSDALEYIQRSGIVTEQEYPYFASNSICNVSIPSSRFIIDYNAYKLFPSNSLRMEIFKKAIKQAPVIARMTIYKDFYQYKFGIYIHKSLSQEQYIGHHVVIIVGWKDDILIKGGGYWICKNSWGQSWGESGYFRIGYDEVNILDRIYMVLY